MAASLSQAQEYVNMGVRMHRQTSMPGFSGLPEIPPSGQLKIPPPGARTKEGVRAGQEDRGSWPRCRLAPREEECLEKGRQQRFGRCGCEESRRGSLLASAEVPRSYSAVDGNFRVRLRSQPLALGTKRATKTGARLRRVNQRIKASQILRRSRPVSPGFNCARSSCGNSTATDPLRIDTDTISRSDPRSSITMPV